MFSYRVADSEMYFGTRYGGSTRPRRTAIVAAWVCFSAPSYEGVGSKAVSAAPLFTHLRGRRGFSAKLTLLDLIREGCWLRGRLQSFQGTQDGGKEANLACAGGEYGDAADKCRGGGAHLPRPGGTGR